MNLKATLTRALWIIERRVDRILPSTLPETAAIEPYFGYGTPDGIVLRGRVHEKVRRSRPRPGQSRVANAGQMFSLFATNEIAGARIAVDDPSQEVVADEEGYFTLKIPQRPAQSGWIEVAARIPEMPGSETLLPAFVPLPEATLGVISDIDDTMMHTGAFSLARTLWTTFTGSALTRRVFPDAVELVERLHDGRNPVFYVSSSPWNLHSFLVDVFTRAGLVRGPMFLRDLGIGETQLITNSHGDHKGAAIDTVMAANPGLPFVLIGDTGQHDAEVYLHAAQRHPGRVRRIILRAPGPGADEDDKRFATEAAALGIDVSMGRDYRHLVHIRPGQKAEPQRSAT